MKCLVFLIALFSLGCSSPNKLDGHWVLGFGHSGFYSEKSTFSNPYSLWSF